MWGFVGYIEKSVNYCLKGVGHHENTLVDSRDDFPVAVPPKLTFFY